MPYGLSVEGETRRLIASTSCGPKGGRSPAARPWPREARRSLSARRPSPSGARSRHPAHPPAGSRARPRRRRGTRRASRSARRPSPRARARPAPGPRPAAAAARPPAGAPPTSAAAARPRLRQRGWRAPTGPRPSHPPRAFSTSSQSPNCKSVSQRTVGRGSRSAVKVGRAPGGGTTVDGVDGLDPCTALWGAVLSQVLTDLRSAIQFARFGATLSTRNGEEGAARHAVAWTFGAGNPDRLLVLGYLGIHEDALYRELVRRHGRDLTHVLGGDAIGGLDRSLRISIPGGVASVDPRVPIAPSSRWASARPEQ